MFSLSKNKRNANCLLIFFFFCNPRISTWCPCQTVNNAYRNKHPTRPWMWVDQISALFVRVWLLLGGTVSKMFAKQIFCKRFCRFPVTAGYLPWDILRETGLNNYPGTGFLKNAKSPIVHHHVKHCPGNRRRMHGRVHLYIR
jgi:hypothetical protein